MKKGNRNNVGNEEFFFFENVFHVINDCCQTDSVRKCQWNDEEGEEEEVLVVNYY